MPFANNGSVRIHYEVEGDGPPIVLLHGYFVDYETLRDLGYVDALKDSYQVVLIDLRGHGMSDKPHDSEDYAWEPMVADVRSVLDALRIVKADIFGYSGGAVIALALAVSSPDRVRSLMVGGAGAARPNPAAGAIADLLGQGMETFIRAAFEASGPLPAEMRARLLQSDVEALRACVLATTYVRSEDALRRMTMPCLVFAGEDDTAFAGLHELAALIPNASFVSYPGLGHVQVYWRSDLVLPHVTAFLARVSSQVV
ncbi:MAG TPA: alpha/beta hydrolase [Dehalococcoidia bacterium]